MKTPSACEAVKASCSGELATKALCATVAVCTIRKEMEDRPLLGKLGLAISYCVAIVYVLSILLPSLYCLHQGCRGPGELDAFMPAFALTPFGAIATAFALRNALQQIRKRRSWSWVFWPPANERSNTTFPETNLSRTPARTAGQHTLQSFAWN